MFSRSAPETSERPESLAQPETPAAVSAPTPKASRALSLLGVELAVTGSIEGSGDLELRGRVFADVRVRRLLITQAAELTGLVEADSVEVWGRVVGPITAREIKLAPSAIVDGDLTYETLQVAGGCQLQGFCRRQPSTPR